MAALYERFDRFSVEDRVGIERRIRELATSHWITGARGSDPSEFGAIATIAEDLPIDHDLIPPGVRFNLFIETVRRDVEQRARHGSGGLSHVSASRSCELENVLEVAGDRGRLVLESPFINAVRLRHTAFGLPRPGKDSDGAVKTLLKRSGLWPLARKIARTATGMDGRSKALTYVGIGLHFQIDHVAACLSGGKLESEVMPLDASCRVMRIIDAARAEMGASDQTPPAT